MSPVTLVRERKDCERHPGTADTRDDPVTTAESLLADGRCDPGGNRSRDQVTVSGIDVVHHVAKTQDIGGLIVYRLRRGVRQYDVYLVDRDTKTPKQVGQLSGAM